LRRIAANHRTRQVCKRRQGEDLNPFGFAARPRERRNRIDAANRLARQPLFDETG
jgi:hypothetical protein